MKFKGSRILGMLAIVGGCISLYASLRLEEAQTNPYPILSLMVTIALIRVGVELISVLIASS